MMLPAWTVKLAAAAVIPILLGAGVAFSAPSLMSTQEILVDQDFRPGEAGVDYAAVTGPRTSELDEGRTCQDPSWPRLPIGCLEAGKRELPRAN